MLNVYPIILALMAVAIALLPGVLLLGRWWSDLTEQFQGELVPVPVESSQATLMRVRQQIRTGQRRSTR